MPKLRNRHHSRLKNWIFHAKSGAWRKTIHLWTWLKPKPKPQDVGLIVRFKFPLRRWALEPSSFKLSLHGNIPFGRSFARNSIVDPSRSIGSEKMNHGSTKTEWIWSQTPYRIPSKLKESPARIFSTTLTHSVTIQPHERDS